MRHNCMQRTRLGSSLCVHCGRLQCTFTLGSINFVLVVGAIFKLIAKPEIIGILLGPNLISMEFKNMLKSN